MPRLFIFALLLTAPALAADPSPVADFLKRPLLPADEVTLELRDHVRPKVPRPHPPCSDQSTVKTAADWEKESERIRQDVLKTLSSAARRRSGGTRRPKSSASTPSPATATASRSCATRS